MVRTPREVPRGMVWAVLCVLALAGMLFLLAGQIRALNAARGTAAGERAALARTEERLKELMKAEAQAAALEKEFERSNRLFPPGPEENVLITDLQTEADRAGMRLLQIRFEERVPRRGYTEMPFAAVFEGRYHNLLRLLAALREGPRALRVDEVKVVQGPAGPPQIRAEITASAFCTAAVPEDGKGGDATQ